MMYKLRILSLGAGVQSTTLLLMAERGIIQKFHCAIFADTGWESEDTYNHLNWLKQVCSTPIMVVRSEKGSILDWSLESQVRNSSKYSVIPYYTSINGNGGILKRQCTDHFKIIPVRKEIRRLLGLRPYQRATKGCVEQCVGISMDEAQRMKLSREQMTVLSYPLVEMGWHRYHCERWLKENFQIIVPKSSCIGCPFHRDDQWRDVKKNPIAWGQAVLLDNTIRESGIIAGTMDGYIYLHKSLKPLEEVDLRTPEEKGQQSFNWAKDEKISMFVNKLSIYNE